MTFRKEAVHVGWAVGLALMALGVVIVDSIMAPVIRGVLGGAFWCCMLALAVSTLVLTLMYLKHIGTTKRMRVLFSLSVIVMSILTHSLFGLVIETFALFDPSNSSKLVMFIYSLLAQLVEASQLVATLVMAGLAVGLLINTFPGVSEGPSESAAASGS
ncbi:hypothetical protein IB223_17840 [Pseudoxanthomonas sp. PXM03]|uniref:hypothetical protein n=1 Tax=Pseudoxanthomonas sp. PXM03 TaxID=2769284 RepID=UPI0017845627|nr:hypothetical protein [Pseudoxanthomonas sp. PXM03]MBD9437965.1 hypothetical protein [Pseudoxanthomonas sp. PXM03]